VLTFSLFFVIVVETMEEVMQKYVMPRITVEYAKALADKMNNEAIRNYQATGWRDKKEYAHYYVEDRKAMRKILPFIRKRQFAEAFEKMQRLDTVLRERIPDEVWDTCKAEAEAERELVESNA
jgi:hypothetical protein